MGAGSNCLSRQAPSGEDINLLDSCQDLFHIAKAWVVRVACCAEEGDLPPHPFQSCAWFHRTELVFGAQSPLGARPACRMFVSAPSPPLVPVSAEKQDQM